MASLPRSRTRYFQNGIWSDTATLNCTVTKPLQSVMIPCSLLHFLVGVKPSSVVLRSFNGLLFQPWMVHGERNEWMTGETDALEGNLPQYRSRHHRSHTWFVPVSNPGLSGGKPRTDRVGYGILNPVLWCDCSRRQMECRFAWVWFYIYIYCLYYDQHSAGGGGGFWLSLGLQLSLITKTVMKQESMQEKLWHFEIVVHTTGVESQLPHSLRVVVDGWGAMLQAGRSRFESWLGNSALELKR
jgi:hypothetical protein